MKCVNCGIDIMNAKPGQELCDNCYQLKLLNKEMENTGDLGDFDIEDIVSDGDMSDETFNNWLTGK